MFKIYDSMYINRPSAMTFLAKFILLLFSKFASELLKHEKRKFLIFKSPGTGLLKEEFKD